MKYNFFTVIIDRISFVANVELVFRNKLFACVLKGLHISGRNTK